MPALIISNEVKSILPTISATSLICRDVDNLSNLSLCSSFLKSKCDSAFQKWGGKVPSEVPEILEWRKAFRAFNSPKDSQSSIEGLYRRVSKGKGLPSISPLVDLYNAVSIMHMVPCGGEDLDRLDGSLSIGIATGSETYQPLGSPEVVENPLPGEIIYQDQTGVVCRAINWRESDRTKITPATRNAIFCIESLTSEQFRASQEAVQLLQELIRTFCGGTSEIETAPPRHL